MQTLNRLICATSVTQAIWKKGTFRDCFQVRNKFHPNTIIYITTTIIWYVSAHEINNYRPRQQHSDGFVVAFFFGR